MLSKLLKYEFKAQAKIYCGIYAFGLILSVIALIFSLAYQYNPLVPFLLVAKEFTFGMLVVLVVVLFSVTLIYSVLRYRSNLLKDEGYLMHTLPVTTRDLVFSKLIVSVCWFMIDGIFSYLLLVIPNRKFGAIVEFLQAADMLEVNKGFFIIFVVVFFLAAVVASLVQFYLCLSIGYTSYGNKDLMSFVAYIVLYVVLQIISGIIMVVTMFAYNRSFLLDFDALNNDGVALGFIKMIFIASLVFSIVLSAIQLFISIRLMDKKLNLE